MANCTLYTDEELIEKIKEIDIALDEAVTRSEIDTSQSKHSYSVSVRQLERQRLYYLNLLKNQNRACYNSIVGPSVIKYGSGKC